MTFSTTQRGVLTGIFIGLSITVITMIAAISWAPYEFDSGLTSGDRIAITLTFDIVIVAWLLISIGRLAKHRFFTAEDIDGGGLSAGTDRAHVLQSILQNTLEQTVLAVFVHMAWAVSMPGAWASVIPTAGLLFFFGRALFTAGYSKGAEARALGFALTFYPSALMMLVMIVTVSAIYLGL